MKKDLCEIIVLLDESGSMGPVKNDTIGGFNEFIETHKKLSGEAMITLVKFNTSSNMVLYERMYKKCLLLTKLHTHREVVQLY